MPLFFDFKGRFFDLLSPFLRSLKKKLIFEITMNTSLSILGVLSLISFLFFTSCKKEETYIYTKGTIHTWYKEKKDYPICETTCFRINYTYAIGKDTISKFKIIPKKPSTLNQGDFLVVYEKKNPHNSLLLLPFRVYDYDDIEKVIAQGKAYWEFQNQPLNYFEFLNNE